MSASSDQQPSSGRRPGYTERLWVPVGWWVLTTLFAFSLAIAVLFYLGPVWAIGAGLLVMIVMGVCFVRYGNLQVRAEADRLWVGDANIEWSYVADARPLDEIATRRRRGPESDARAYLVLRPYLGRAVEVRICDQSDPTPYWLISTRAPERLAATITAACRRAGTVTQAAPKIDPDTAERLGTSPPGDTLGS